MTSITVRTQAELDKALADQHDEIIIDSDSGVWLRIEQATSSRVVAWGYSSVEAWGSSRVEARGSSSVVARDSSSVEARGSSSVVARGSSSVVARDSSRVEARGYSSVVARDSSSVVAWGYSSVEAWGSSRVEARGSSSVEAWDSSSVVARGSSRVVARGSSSVVARDSSRVVAWGYSSVVARDSSSVEAGRCVAVHLHSQRVTLSGGVIIDMTKLDMTDPATWCEVRGVKVTEVDGVKIATVYKALNDRWTTDRDTDYSPGSTPEAIDWEPTEVCGQGLHFGVSPSHSAEYFRGATKYVRVGVRLDEMVPLDDKVKAKRVVTACVEVDRHGDEVSA